MNIDYSQELCFSLEILYDLQNCTTCLQLLTQTLSSHSYIVISSTQNEFCNRILLNQVDTLNLNIL